MPTHRVRIVGEPPPVIGGIGPAADGVDLGYWEGLAAGELRLPRCRGCGTWVWAPQWHCPACHRPGPAWEAVEPEGTVHSWTRSHHAFSPEVTDLVPYVTVLVALPAAGDRRLLGLLVDSGIGDRLIGRRVRGEIQPASSATSGWPVLRFRSIDPPTRHDRTSR